MKDTLPIDGAHFLYKITNLVNGKAYIGVTNNPARRYRQHVIGTRKGSIVHSAITKYGEDCFSFEVIVIGSMEYVYDTETKAIKAYSTLVPCGYNICTGGVVNSGRAMSSRQRESLSGVNNYSSKLTESDLDTILDNKTLTNSQVAQMVGVSHKLVSEVRTRKTYRNYRRDEEFNFDGATKLSRSLANNGEASSKAKLREVDVRYILSDEDSTSADIAKYFGLNEQTIYDIRNGNSWKHIERPTGVKYKDGNSPTNRKTSLTESKYLDIKAFLGSGASVSSASKLFSISIQMASRVRDGKINKHSNFKKEE